MQQGIFPDILKVGRITPVYKNKGSKQLFENHRPISILPIFGKIFEKLIYTRLYDFLTSNKLMYSKQFGFRKGHSCSHALNYSASQLTSALADKKHVIGIFIDLSKAFDTISHEQLTVKLSNFGIRGNAHNLLKSYLTNRTQYSKFLDESSDPLPIKFGVPQGSILSPLLFLIYVNFSIMTEYTEHLWQSSIRNEYLLDGYNTFPTPKCAKLPLTKGTSRESEVLVMSMFYDNNLLNSSLYKVNPSKFKTAGCECGRDTQTAYHVLMECTLTDPTCRRCCFETLLSALSLEAVDESHITLLNASRSPSFISSVLSALENTAVPLRKKVILAASQTLPSDTPTDLLNP